MAFIVDPIDTEFPEEMAVPEPGYAVVLRDFPDLPDKERMAAEVRYCKALERRIGSPALVAQTLRTVLAHAEDGAESEEASTLAMRWRLANTAARQVGLQGLGDLPEAYFDVHTF